MKRIKLFLTTLSILPVGISTTNLVSCNKNNEDTSSNWLIKIDDTEKIVTTKSLQTKHTFTFETKNELSADKVEVGINILQTSTLGVLIKIPTNPTFSGKQISVPIQIYQTDAETNLKNGDYCTFNVWFKIKNDDDTTTTVNITNFKLTYFIDATDQPISFTHLGTKELTYSSTPKETIYGKIVLIPNRPFNSKTDFVELSGINVIYSSQYWKLKFNDLEWVEGNLVLPLSATFNYPKSYVSATGTITFDLLIESQWWGETPQTIQTTIYGFTLNCYKSRY